MNAFFCLFLWLKPLEVLVIGKIDRNREFKFLFGPFCRLAYFRYFLKFRFSGRSLSPHVVKLPIVIRQHKDIALSLLVAEVFHQFLLFPHPFFPQFSQIILILVITMFFVQPHTATPVKLLIKVRSTWRIRVTHTFVLWATWDVTLRFQCLMGKTVLSPRWSLNGWLLRSGSDKGDCLVLADETLRNSIQAHSS